MSIVLDHEITGPDPVISPKAESASRSSPLGNTVRDKHVIPIDPSESDPFESRRYRNCFALTRTGIGL